VSPRGTKDPDVRTKITKSKNTEKNAKADDEYSSLFIKVRIPI